MSVVYYCGCLRDKGHFIYTPGDRGGDLTPPAGFPWKHPDSTNFAPRRRQQNDAAIWHLDGWALLRITDYTIDSRGGSHSTFFTHEGLGVLDMLPAAKAAWPTVIARLEACGPIVLEFHETST